MNQTKNPASPAFVPAVDHGVEVALRVANVWGLGAGSIFESVGSFLFGGLDALGNVLRGVPGIGNILRGMFHWLGTIFSAGFDLVAILIYSLVSLLANLLGGMVRILAGLLGMDGDLMQKGMMDLFFGFAGAVIAVVAKLVALIQAVLFLQMGERPLSEYEQEIVRRVYRNSIAVRNIRVVTGFVGLFSTNNRPFTLGHRIYFRDIDPQEDPALFAHECCHIWQFQCEGVRYLIEALWARWTVENEYSWEAELARGHVHWQDFNREAQAQLVQDVYNGGRQMPPSNTRGEFYTDDPIGENVAYKRRSVDYTELARTTVTWIRNKGASGE